MKRGPKSLHSGNFVAGQLRPGQGRPVGVGNKTTMRAREAISLFVEGNVDRLSGWLDEIAKDNPKAAFDAFMSVVEYHIPRLARKEHTGEGGGAITFKWETTPEPSPSPTVRENSNNQSTTP